MYLMSRPTKKKKAFKRRQALQICMYYARNKCELVLDIKNIAYQLSFVLFLFITNQ